MSNSTQSGSLIGGNSSSYSENATASENSVVLTDSKQSGGTYGGYAVTKTGKTTSNGNNITIKGSEQNGRVFTSSAVSTGGSTASDSTLTVENTKVIGDAVGGYAALSSPTTGAVSVANNK